MSNILPIEPYTLPDVQQKNSLYLKDTNFGNLREYLLGRKQDNQPDLIEKPELHSPRTTDYLAVEEEGASVYDLYTHFKADIPRLIEHGIIRLVRNLKDKTVLDVGSRDARFVPIFQKMGASEIFALGPDENALQKGVSEGLVDNDHAIFTTLQQCPDSLKGKIDVAFCLNLILNYDEYEEYFKALHKVLATNGQVHHIDS